MVFFKAIGEGHLPFAEDVVALILFAE